jgi:hypothetical protein
LCFLDRQIGGFIAPKRDRLKSVARDAKIEICCDAQHRCSLDQVREKLGIV